MGWSSWLLFLLFFVLHSHQPLLSSPLPSPSSPLCHPTESSALLQFSNSFSIIQNTDYHLYDWPNIIMYPKTVSWKNGTDCCSWDGVSCDRISGHVIGLDLSSSCLRGPLHSNNTLFSLRHLRSLILDFNDFSGSPIPPELGSFANLKWLSLDNANFWGYVPVELSHLSKLSHLTISSTIICAGGPRCSIYDLEFDTYVFKRMLQNLTSLRELSLIYLDMSGVEPVTSFMNISSSLMVLDLNRCVLQGEFPENVFRLPNLQYLDLFGSSNDLIGSLPTSNWSSPLESLDLSGTRISIDLSYLCTSAKSLQTLSLRNCRFRGSYPALTPNLTQLVQLTFLDLSENNFEGQIPMNSLNLQQLIYLSLSENNFVGQIPEISVTNSTQIPLPVQLKYLYLYSNMLSGSIPSWIYSLPFLKDLFLAGNQLTGPIEDFESRSLESLDLGGNKLNGQNIPRSIFQQDNLERLDLSSCNLSGVLELKKFSKFKSLWLLDLSSNSFSLSLNSYGDHNPFPRLIHLGLASCNMTAFPYFLSSFERLDTINLSHNQIRGKIPKWLCHEGTRWLSYLNLSHNFLSRIDRIPWNDLEYLDIRSNMLRGHLPIVPPSLRTVFISNNHLSGEIPSLYCECGELEILDFSNNSFSGNIPSCLGNQLSLSVLDLQMNELNGTIPDMFENLTQLRSLHLKGNQLEGLLPRSLRNCESLEVLDVGNNKINDTFPQWLEDLPTLKVLVLKSNRFHGSVRKTKAKSPFQKLHIMDLSNNEFNGHLPTKYFESFIAMMEGDEDKNFTVIGEQYYQDSVVVVMKDSDIVLEKIISIFRMIDFSRNKFEGEIPGSIGMLKSLKGMNLSRNKLTSTIPSSLSNLTNLEWLDLSSNELVGEIPWQMTDLTQLAFLNLSHNKLVGPIPHGKQFDTFSNDSYCGNLGLCGFPLSQSCSNEEVQQEGDHDEEHTDGIFDWMIVMMGYGCGTVIGISVGYMVLFSRRFDYWLRNRVGGGRGRRMLACLMRGGRGSN
ncbi:LRR domain containing protein [Trema orientale]|uniref:LRR domain containing protein n=1 Tax=Trema orientale TaxID=63057 RepID=A0A2P5F8G3_TREOI|nr:LRR domain containing protein [Trema orientale]